MARGKRQKPARPVQLELFSAAPPATPAASEVWQAAEAFQGKLDRFNRTRKKLVRRKMHQVVAAQLLAEPPHLTQGQADALDDLVVFDPD